MGKDVTNALVLSISLRAGTERSTDARGDALEGLHVAPRHDAAEVLLREDVLHLAVGGGADVERPVSAALQERASVGVFGAYRVPPCLDLG